MADVPHPALVALVGDDQLAGFPCGPLSKLICESGVAIGPLAFAAEDGLTAEFIHYAVLPREELRTRCTVVLEIR